GLRLTDHRIVEFTTALDVDGIVDLARTRSYWLRADERTRDRVESNLREYFREEHPVTEAIELPYRCLAYLLDRGRTQPGGPHPMTGAARPVSVGLDSDQPSVLVASSDDVDSTTSASRFDEVCDTVILRGRASSATGMVRVSTPSL